LRFLQLLGVEILKSGNVQIKKMNVATIEDSEENVIEWMYVDAAVCTTNQSSGGNSLCAEFVAEAEFSDDYAYVKFSKLEFRNIPSLTKGGRS